MSAWPVPSPRGSMKSLNQKEVGNADVKHRAWGCAQTGLGEPRTHRALPTPRRPERGRKPAAPLTRVRQVLADGEHDCTLKTVTDSQPRVQRAGWRVVSRSALPLAMRCVCQGPARRLRGSLRPGAAGSWTAAPVPVFSWGRRQDAVVWSPLPVSGTLTGFVCTIKRTSFGNIWVISLVSR